MGGLTKILTLCISIAIVFIIIKPRSVDFISEICHFKLSIEFPDTVVCFFGIQKQTRIFGIKVVRFLGSVFTVGCPRFH